MLTGVALEQLHGVTFKKRAPRAIKEIKAFAYKSMVGKPSPNHHETIHIHPARPENPATEHDDGHWDTPRAKRSNGDG